MSDWYPLTSDDAGPTAKVGGEPPGRVWGSSVPLGTLWMVLCGWSMKKVARAVPFYPQGSSSNYAWAGFRSCGRTGEVEKKSDIILI